MNFHPNDHTIPAKVRFWAKVKNGSIHPVHGRCWIRLCSHDPKRYGQLMVDGRIEVASRYSWIIHFGAIPLGMHVLHKCDNRICVRPLHLFLGTNLDNRFDCVQKGRQKAPKGSKHNKAKFTEEIVAVIRTRYKPRCLIDGASAMAKEYKVHRCTIERIISRIRWNHLFESPLSSSVEIRQKCLF